MWFGKTDSLAAVVRTMRPVEAHQWWDMGAYSTWGRASAKRLDDVLDRLDALGADSGAIGQARAGVAEVRAKLPKEPVVMGSMFDTLKAANQVAFEQARALAVRTRDAETLATLHRPAWPRQVHLDQDLHLRRPSEVLDEAELLLVAPDAPQGSRRLMSIGDRADIAARLLRHLDPDAVPPAIPDQDWGTRIEDLTVIAATLRARVGASADAIDAAWAESRSLNASAPALAPGATDARVQGARRLVTDGFPGVDALAGAAASTAPLLDEATLVGLQHEARWIARAFEEHADPAAARAANQLAEELGEQQARRGGIEFWSGQVPRDVAGTLVGDAERLVRDPALTVQAHGARDAELVASMAGLRSSVDQARARVRSVLSAASDEATVPAPARGAAMAARAQLPSVGTDATIDPSVADAIARAWRIDPDGVVRRAATIRAAAGAGAAPGGGPAERLFGTATRLEQALLADRAELATQLELLSDAALRGRLVDVEPLREAAGRLIPTLDQLEALQARIARLGGSG